MHVMLNLILGAGDPLGAVDNKLEHQPPGLVQVQGASEVASVVFFLKHSPS
uniref:Uncharacterized protein n=1 Tax=Candidozyma auris TaxID=498019 RepID=A0A0L0NV69_CANAR